MNSDEKNQELREVQCRIEAELAQKNKILCQHCLRTLTNGIRCLGKCVADNDY